MADIFKIIENEINEYQNGQVQISEGYQFSQYSLIKRLSLYANKIYPKGKLDSQGNYKYWIDIIQPRIDSEIKNIDFDTKDISLYSDVDNDAGAILLLNLFLKEWLRDNNQSVELNDAIEEGSGWGNVVWKKIKDGYERVDLKNFYVINQQAKCLDDSPVIERHILTQSELRSKDGVWKNIEDVIKICGNKGFSNVIDGVVENKETPYYEVYERNGEISVARLKEAKEETPSDGDEDKYVLAKIIVAGLRKNRNGNKFVLFAEELPNMPYKEYHRGRYSGRWFRTGIIELLLDIQTRANEISNQISKGLEWSAKAIFRSQDRMIASNILTDLANGDIIRSQDLQQVNMRMEGIDQLIADWNRLMQVADKLCNSYEVVSGEGMPSGTPFRLGSMLNQNANKLFDFIREKLSIAVQDVFQDWVVPKIIRDIKPKDVLRVTGDSEQLNRFYELATNGWYIKNLLAFPPHTAEEGNIIRQQHLNELKSKPEQIVKLEKGWLDGVKPRVNVMISGENVNLTKDLENLATFIQLEMDPVRRTALIEKSITNRGIDIVNLPKQMQPQPQAPNMAVKEEKQPLEQQQFQ